MKWKCLGIMFFLASAAFAQKLVLRAEVIDENGNAIEGVEAVITVAGDDAFKMTGTTDKKGYLTIVGMKAGSVTVALSKEGYASRTYEYLQDQARQLEHIKMFSNEATLADDAMRPRLTGKVIDSKGTGIPGVELTFTVEGLPAFEHVLTTDEEGRFATRGLADSTVKIYARKAEYRDWIYNVTMGKKAADIADFKIPTLDEAYAELGIERPKEVELTDEDKAIELYNQAVDPYQAENYKEAEDIVVQALALVPDMDAALKLAIFANQAQEDWEDVLKYSKAYLKVVHDDPKITQIALDAANSANKTDDAKKYENILKKTGQITPDSLFNKAVEWLNKGNDEKALPLLDEILKMDKNFARAYLEIGKIKVREFEFDEAIVQLKTYLKLAPKNDPYRKEAEDLIITLAE